MTNESKYHFPLDPANPESFIDYSLINLVSIDDAFELNEMLGAFLAEDVIQHVEKNRDMYFILGEIWNESIRKIILDKEDVTFPDGLLILPPLFHRLGWATKNDTWDSYQQKFEEKNKHEPNLVYALILLFIQSMQTNLEEAQQTFSATIDALDGDELMHAQRFEENLKYFGWPEVEETTQA